MTVDYGGKKTKVAFDVFPSPQISNTVVEPYNSVLTVHSILEHEHLSILIDNQALYKICSQGLDIESSNYSEINQIIAQAYCSLSAPLRFGGILGPTLR